MRVRANKTNIMNTLENNKLIAEFMGAYVGNPMEDGREVLCGVPAYYSKKGFTNTHLTEDLKYHKSWDWLIPVVEKICAIEDGEGYKFRRSLDGGLFIGIDNVYNTATQFIQWYNNQNK